MVKCLPPVGNPIYLKDQEDPRQLLSKVLGPELHLYASGTMALAAALIAARNFRAVPSPEVLLPAYACPDLISAVVFAGIRPVLIDLVQDRPWMDLEILKQNIGPNTIAVIAVHFLGIPERLNEIRSTLVGTDVLLIEDSAQLFPLTKADGVWEGDLVVLSFGRGKPVSLLEGGACLCKNKELLDYFSPHTKLTGHANNSTINLKYILKIKVYNFLLMPLLYGLVCRLPFLGVGETYYKPLASIDKFELNKVRWLATNIDVYQHQKRESQEWIRQMLASGDKNLIIDISAIMDRKIKSPLLRYPVLVKNKTTRDKLKVSLLNNGIGASVMYKKPLVEIDGIEAISGSGAYPMAKEFSERLLTLPCHNGVKISHVKVIKEIVSKII